nr:DUF655 domain-containing protein [Candidatus Sigynarchaeota archaeon]
QSDGRDYSRPRYNDDSGSRVFRDRDAGYQGPPKRYEDYAWELDFLPHGYMDDPRPRHLRDPLVQVIGEQYFSILEIILERDMADNFTFDPGKRIFIGKGEENTIGHRFKRIGFEKLTINAKAELERILERVIEADPARFLAFFNNSQPLTNRMHQLELLPGVGKKTMWQIIESRKKKPFESFADLQERAGIKKPQELIIKRILHELEVPEEKYHVFVRH